MFGIMVASIKHNPRIIKRRTKAPRILGLFLGPAAAPSRPTVGNVWPESDGRRKTRDEARHQNLTKIGTFRILLGWAGRLPDHLADLLREPPKLINVTVVAPWTI